MKIKDYLVQLLAGIFFLTFSVNSYSQNNATAIANADTTNFSVNAIGGWQLFNSYVDHFSTDSIQLELIVQHEANLNWTQEQYLGNVKTDSLFPQVEQTISFNLLTTVYKLRVDTEGKCYLWLFTGTPPLGDPVVVPLKVIYKK